MSEFPATVLTKDRFVSFPSLIFSGKGVYSTSYSTECLVYKQVHYHTSVRRSKGDVYLPESYLLRRLNTGIHSNETRYGYRGEVATQIDQSTSPYFSGPLSWDWTSSILQLQDPTSSLRNKCLLKAFDKLNQDRANLTVDLVEAKQTLRLVKSLVSVKKAAEELRRAFRSRKPTRSRRKYVIVYDNNGRPTKERRYFDIPGKPGVDSHRLEYMRDKWLEARFGIRPLMSSIFDTMRALLNRHVTGCVTIKVHAGAAFNKVNTQGNGSFGSPAARYTVLSDARATMILRFKLPTNQGYMADFFSMNPAGVAWEAMPLSFVADWFWNVGQTMQAWEDWFRYSSSFSGGMFTVVVRESRFISYSGTSVYPYVYWPNGQYRDYTFFQQKKGSSSCVVTRKDRQVLTQLPTPAAPVSRINLDSAKIVDLCGIISHLLKS